MVARMFYLLPITSSFLLCCGNRKAPKSRGSVRGAKRQIFAILLFCRRETFNCWLHPSLSGTSCFNVSFILAKKTTTFFLKLFLDSSLCKLISTLWSNDTILLATHRESSHLYFGTGRFKEVWASTPDELSCKSRCRDSTVRCDHTSP